MITQGKGKPGLRLDLFFQMISGSIFSGLLRRLRCSGSASPTRNGTSLGKLGLLSGNINNYLFIVLLLLESYYLVTVTITFFIFLLLLQSLRIIKTRKSEYLHSQQLS